MGGMEKVEGSTYSRRGSSIWGQHVVLAGSAGCSVGCSAVPAVAPCMAGCSAGSSASGQSE